MKTQFKRFSKSTISVLLAVCLLFSCMTVGIIATSAAQSDQERLGAVDDSEALGYTSIAGRLYFDNSKTNWSNVYLYVGHGSYAKSYTMTNTGYHNIWYLDISDGFTDRTKIYFANHNDSPNGQNYGIDTQYGWNTTNTTRTALTTANNNDANSLFTPSSNSAGTLTRSYPRVVAGTLASNGWDDCTDIMTYSSSQWTKTYTNVASGDYVIAVVGFYNNWSPAYRWNAKGTGTGCTLSDANDGDHNIKFTVSSLSDVTVTLTSSNKVNVTVTAKSTNYTGITAVAKGTTDGTNYSVDLGTIQSSTTVSSSTGLSVSAPAKDGYTFSKWIASGSGTFDSATSASTKFHPAASSEIATAQYKKNYTFSNGTTDTHGTVTVPSGTVLAGASYSGTVTPADGYKIKSLTVGGNTVTAAAGKTSAYNYSGTTGSSTTGTSTPISVVAAFEPNTSLQLYIAGRFRVRPSEGSSSWTTTYASGSDWNATSTNIPFTYLSGTTYKVDTYASLAELSAKPTNNQDPWFFVYDKTNSKAWHPTTQNRELGTTTEYNLTTNTDTYNVRFNSSSTDSPVTIYFDYNTKRLWYSVPDLYDVTVASVTGGSVTASPARAEAGTEITLTISPTEGWELTNITTSSDVTLSGTGNTRTFTMPESNVTVTPTFAKKSFSNLTAVAKYSTTGADNSYTNTDFTNTPNITIADTSATQVDGVAVTAPANDPDGYVFAGWYTTTGRFANAANKDTTFYPNAANAVAIAKYKKIFKITSSVDNTGTGAGTVETSKTSVEAGGSYTITATVKSGSAIESVKVNGTAKTATASQTISSVSADQTVVVKFKSNVYLRGGSTIGSNWTTGDVMQADSAGTTFTKSYSDVAGSSGGTTYYFKLHNGDYVNPDSTTTVTITGGNSTATYSYQTSGDKNNVLTLKKNCNITITSNGSKITSITVRPTTVVQKAITFKHVDGVTITGTYDGTNFSTASADATVNVYQNDDISFTVTAASGKYISTLTGATFTPAFSAASTYTGKIANVTAAATITPTAAAKLAVAAKTNKSARGTVSVDKTTAAPGETIKITVSPKNGTLKTLTLSYAGGATYKWDGSSWVVQASSLNATQLSVESAIAMIYDFFGKSDFALGAASGDEAVGADQTINYTLPSNASGAITINATFDAYSGESTWYYNGYDNSGNAVSGYHTKQMTESMVGGEKFSYYHVEGRTGTDQLMTVSDGAASSGTRYIYFTASAEGGWSTDENHQYAYFYNNSGDAGNAWPGYKMTKYTTNDYGQNVYRVEIPTASSPTGVIFNNASNAAHQTTNVTDLSKGGYYLLNTSHWDDSLQKTIHDWQSYDCTYPSAGYSTGTEYFYKDSTYNGDYTDDFSTKGFYNHNTASKEFAKPKELGTNTGDYYINVLYPNTTYTINGVTKKTGTNPMIIWSAEPLAGDDETVTVYAKDGAIRSETNGSTYANIADTKIYLNDATVGTKHSGNITNQTWETYKAAKGDTLVIKTQIGATDSGTLSNAADLKAKYYVRGFCVNGEVSQLLEWNTDGLYTLTYKVPEDTELTKIEITPIYYLKDTTANPIVTYRATGFTDELKAVGSGKPGWGDTLYTYPFYGKLGGQNNALGAYPGQPMVYYKGQYQMQIPQKSTAWDIYYDDGALSGYNGNTAKANAVANTTVSGVTMSNGYYDIVHRQIMGYGSNGASSDHVQTYDYGDFYKIFNEKKPVDNIVFDFKYETKKHNFENQPAASVTKSTLDTNYGTNGNGFELLTNFHGRTVDLFGTPLSGDAADPSKTTPVYVVSIGGVNGSAGVENIAGYYATEWMVYGSSNGTDYTRISAGDKNSIPPEVLVLNDATSFNTTTYPSADANHTINDWKALYTALEAYRGKPVMISYEAADAQIGAGNYATSGGGGATRNDGRWLYSKNGENITSNIKIQYSNDNGVTYTDLDTSDPQVTGLSAYFTNDGVEGQMTYSTTIDPDKTFDFEAKTTNANYKFVGWFMEDGTKITSDNASHTERSGSYTFVAKFMQVQSGQLILSHSADKGNISGTDYQGAGTAKISAVVKDGDEVVRTYDLSTSDITLDDKIIKSDSTYTIEVTLEATATGNDALGTTVLANPSGQESTYFTAASTTTVDKTKTIVLNSFTVQSLFSGTDQNVKNIIYHSYFTAAIFHYKLKFEYKDRFGNDKVFYRDGNLTSAQAANTDYVERVENGAYSTRYLRPAFIETIAPHVSNFGETITWNLQERTFSFTVNDYYYNCDHYITATTTASQLRNVTFNLPYAHNNGVATLDNDGYGTAATAPNFERTGVDNAVEFGKIPALTKAKDGSLQKADWVTAPTRIKDGSTVKIFKYWNVTTTSNRNTPVAKCYYPGFNLLVYDNYIITPVYEESATAADKTGIRTDITFVETSRNQWNDNQNREAGERTYAADLLYNDFIVSFYYNGKEISYGEADADIQEMGIVVERVQQLYENQDGSLDTTLSRYTSIAVDENKVDGIINGTVTDSKFSKSEISKDKLDNKDRIQYYKGYYNSAGWVQDAQKAAKDYSYKNYVYRAYSYIKTKSGDIIKCDVPAYFTMYDEATAGYSN